jgi:Spy/CpxP family protein refolding chaperone
MIGHSWIRRGMALLAAGGLSLSLAAGIARAEPVEGGQRPGKAARQERQGRVRAILEKLELSAAQKERIRALRERQREEVRALRQGSAGDREAMRGRRRELRTKYRAELMAVLTPEQRQQLKAERKKARAARRAAKAPA